MEGQICCARVADNFHAAVLFRQIATSARSIPPVGQPKPTYRWGSGTDDGGGDVASIEDSGQWFVHAQHWSEIAGRGR